MWDSSTIVSIVSTFIGSHHCLHYNHLYHVIFLYSLVELHPCPYLVDGSTIHFPLAIIFIPFDNPNKLVDGSHTGYNFIFFLLFSLLFTIIVKPSSLINCLPFSPLGAFALSSCPLQLIIPFILFYLSILAQMENPL
jgi:hypothetical protein